MLKRFLAGFTLIELVMLIVIGGVLVAFAIPRYADLGGDARRASVQRIGYDLKSAAAYVHSKAQAVGHARAPSASIDVNDRPITIKYGYPDIMSVKTAARFSPDANDYKEMVDRKVTPPRVTWDKVGGATGACSVVYSEASPRQPATVITATSGC